MQQLWVNATECYIENVIESQISKEKIKKLCLDMNIKFLGLWDHFLNEIKYLYVNGRIHKNFVGKVCLRKV